jgi:hypothetical protein
MKQEKDQSGLVVALAAGCLFAGTPLMAEERSVTAQASVEQLEELKTVVVYGGHASPQMWKISKDGHVLWMLVFGGAPVGFPWDSKQLEERVAQSQLLLRPANVMAADYEGRLREEGRYARLPDKDTLKDVLPPETYARWRALSTTYVGSGDWIDHLRPRAALIVLESEVMKKMPPPPPTGWSELWRLIDRAVKKYKVPVRNLRPVDATAELTKAEAEMANMATRLKVDDVKCFTQGIADLERLVKDWDRWANTLQPSACRPDLLTSGKLPDLAALQSARKKMDLQFWQAIQKGNAEWMAAARAALKRNKSTFAVVYVSDERASNHIAKFRELGYEVEEPGSAVE